MGQDGRAKPKQVPRREPLCEKLGIIGQTSMQRQNRRKRSCIRAEKAGGKSTTREKQSCVRARCYARVRKTVRHEWKWVGKGVDRRVAERSGSWQRTNSTIETVVGR